MFTIEALQAIFPHYEGKKDSGLSITEVVTDSRLQTNNGLFIPIRGENFDGHRFIHDAIHNGAVATLWDKSIDIPEAYKQSIIYFYVDDTIEALQELAKYYREKINPRVIGITGSNGKTSTKDLLHAVLQTRYKTHATAGNFNNHIGLPLTVLQMPADTEILILEMGMSDFKEIERLSKIAMPDEAIITNIGESHIEHLGSREGIANAKLEIKAGLSNEGSLIIDGDEPLLKEEHEDANVITCGFSETNDYLVTDVHIGIDETRFKVNNVAYQIPLLGKHHAQNSSFIIALAEKLAVKQSDIQKGMQQLQYSKMRFEQIKGKNSVTLINDAYNASPTSMKAAIEVVKQLSGFKEKVIVLGDVLELGDYTETLHRQIADAIDEGIQYVYLYGESARFIHEALNDKQVDIHHEHVETEAALIEKLMRHANDRTVMLFKASRGMAFERFVETLSE